MNFKYLFLVVFFLGLSITSAISIWAHHDNVIIVYGFEDQNDEIKFIEIAIEYHEASGIGAASYWTIDLDEVINGPQPWSDQVNVVTSQATAPPWGYVDPDIEEGDKVEVYGRYLQWLVDPDRESITLNGSGDYYIKVSSGDTGNLFGFDYLTIALIGIAVIAIIVIVVYFILRYRKSRTLSSSTITQS